MIRKFVSLFMALSLILTMTTGFAGAYDSPELMSGSFEFGGVTYPYKYREENGEIVYAEVGSDIIERKGNEIFVNDIKVASYTEISLSPSSVPAHLELNSIVQPRTGWMWSETGNPSDYESTAYDTVLRDIALEKTLGALTVGSLAAVIVLFLPIPTLAKEIADIAISYATGVLTAYLSSKSLYCLERTYKNKYIGLSYAKMVKQEYYYDSDCTDAVPNSNKTIYGSWG